MKNHKNVCSALIYFEHSLAFVCADSGCVSISAFASLVDVPVGSTSSVIEKKICATTAGIKRY